MNSKQFCSLALPAVQWVVLFVWRKFIFFFSHIHLNRLAFLGVIRVIGFGLAILKSIFLGIEWLRSTDRTRFWNPDTCRSIPTVLLSPTLGRHGTIKLKDIKLHYVEAGYKRKPLLLCLHGFAESWYSWKHQLKVLSKTHWIVAVDMRGYGNSDKPQRVDRYHLSVLVEDVRQLIVKLIGNKACVLMGHDWGGLVGWFFAASYPNMLTHFIALGMPHPSEYRRLITGSIKQMISFWDVLFFYQVPWIPEITLRINDNQWLERQAVMGLTCAQDAFQEVEAFKYYYSLPGAWNGPVNHYRKLFSPQSLLWQPETQLRVRVPTLLITGEKDPIFAHEIAQKCAKHVDNFRHEIIKGASRWIHREDPQAVNGIIAEFLNSSL